MYSTSKIDATHLMKQMGFNINPYEISLLNKKNEEKTQVVNTYISVTGHSRSYITSINIDKFTEDMSAAKIRASYSITIEKDKANYRWGMSPDKDSPLIQEIDKIENYTKLLVALSNKNFKIADVDVTATISFKEKLPVITDVQYSIRSNMFNNAIKDNVNKLDAIEYVNSKLAEHNLSYNKESVQDLVKVFEMLFI